MLATLALALLAAPARAVPCGTNFTISPANDPGACLDATYSSGFAYSVPCGPVDSQKWTWDGFKIHNFVGSAGNAACLTFAPFNTQNWVTGQVGLQGCGDPTAGQRNAWLVNSKGQLTLDEQVEGRTVCLDLRDGNTKGGAAQVFDCVDGNTNQQWILRTV